MAEGWREPSRSIPRSRCPAARARMCPHRCRPQFDVVEVANEVALVDGQAVGELVLREWSEVGECGEYRERGSRRSMVG
jgi:hypothetical protein